LKHIVDPHAGKISEPPPLDPCQAGNPKEAGVEDFIALFRTLM